MRRRRTVPVGMIADGISAIINYPPPTALAVSQVVLGTLFFPGKTLTIAMVGVAAIRSGRRIPTISLMMRRRTTMCHPRRADRMDRGGAGMFVPDPRGAGLSHRREAEPVSGKGRH